MDQSLSNLFSSGSSAVGATAGLFSDAARQKFARVYKAEEFDLPKAKKTADPTDEDSGDDVEPLETHKKKRKERKRKSEDVANGGDVAVDAAQPSSGTGDAKSDDSLTIFVGNIPVTETVKSLTKFFKVYGEIDSIRLRSVPIAGAKVDEAGNQDLVKKVCVNSKKFGEQKGSFNAYIKFKEVSAATAALGANNQLIGKRHIRVDRSNPTLFDPKRSVFLGGLPHYADEEDIREFFAQSLPNGQDDIEGLRIIRDSATLVGKGIGYLLLKDRDCVLKALALHKTVYKKRWPLRVSACGKRTKRSEQDKARQSPAGADADGDADGDAADDASGDTAPGREGKSAGNKRRHEDRGEDRKGKRSKKGSEATNPALRRLKHKSVMTRNKLLIERKQKKAQKGRHGKRLGGVIKRAMKAQKMQK